MAPRNETRLWELNDLIPDGYITPFDAVSLIGADMFGDAWQDLNPSPEEDSARDRHSAHQKRSKVFRAKRASGQFPGTPPDPLPPEDQKLIAGLDKRGKEIEERRTEATNSLRQTLYSNQLTAYVLDEGGSIILIPSRVWFSADVTEILQSGRAEFQGKEDGHPRVRRGGVLFREEDLKNASTANSPQRGIDTDLAEFIFLEDEKRWRISFEGITKFLPDSKNLRRIAFLLEYPDKKIPATQLVKLGVEDKTQTAESLGNMSEEQLAGENLSKSRFRENDLKEEDRNVLSSRASLKVYRAEIKLLKEEQKEVPTTEEKEEIDRKIKILECTIKQAKGLPGRPATFNDMSKSAHSPAKSNITRGIASIHSALPELASHLDSSISKSFDLCYSPDNPPNWQL